MCKKATGNEAGSPAANFLQLKRKVFEGETNAKLVCENVRKKKSKKGVILHNSDTNDFYDHGLKNYKDMKP